MFLSGIEKAKIQTIAVYLFGSRARETYRPDSDYDVLVVAKNKSIKDALYDLAVDIFCQTGDDISLKILTQAEFERLRSLRTPFIENVLNEGIRIG